MVCKPYAGIHMESICWNRRKSPFCNGQNRFPPHDLKEMPICSLSRFLEPLNFFGTFLRTSELEGRPFDFSQFQIPLWCFHRDSKISNLRLPFYSLMGFRSWFRAGLETTPFMHLTLLIELSVATEDDSPIKKPVSMSQTEQMKNHRDLKSVFPPKLSH